MINTKPKQHLLAWSYYYRRALFQAWLLPDLNITPDNRIKENSLYLSGYGIGFSSSHPWFKSCPKLLFLPHILFICFFVTNFVHKMGSLLGQAFERLMPFNVQNWTSCLIRLSVINKCWLCLREVELWETTPSSMAASRFKYNTWQQRWREFCLAQLLWYWLFVQASLVQILFRP